LAEIIDAGIFIDLVLINSEPFFDLKIVFGISSTSFSKRLETSTNHVDILLFFCFIQLVQKIFLKDITDFIGFILITLSSLLEYDHDEEIS
jgi:hypothetical protein